MSALLPKKHKLSNRSWLLGTILDNLKPFVMHPKHAAIHMAVLGASGSGKSKFMELMLRYKLACGHAGMLIDPHNDLADGVMSFVAFLEKEGNPLWKKVHFLDIGKHRAFRIDPFARLPLRGTLPREMYFHELKTVVDRTKRTLLRRYAEADLDIMNRLSRNLENALYACGVALDGKNSHLGMHKALALCDPYHEEFRPLLNRVFDHLPVIIQSDFRRLRDTMSEIVKDKWESAINQFRKVLSPIMSLCFTPSGAAINMKEIIDRQEFVIARCGQTRDNSYDAKLVWGGLLIDEVLNVREGEENLPQEFRKPFWLDIDESGEFLGEDLQRAMKATRKYGLSLTLAGQNLNSLVKGNLDLISEVLTNCQTIVCFQNRLRSDQEILVDRMGTPNRSLTKRMVRRQYHEGYMRVMVTDRSYGKQSSQSVGVGLSETESNGTSDGRTEGNAKTWADGASSAKRQGSNEVRDNDGHVQSRSGGHDAVEAKTHSDGGTKSEAYSQVTNHSLSLGRTTTENNTTGESTTVSEKTTLLAKIVNCREWDGTYEEGTMADQRELQIQQIHCQEMAEAIVSLRGAPLAFPVKIAHVKELWPHPLAKHEYTEIVKQKVAFQHPYTFSPIDVCWARERQAELLADEPVVIAPDIEDEELEINPLA